MRSGGRHTLPWLGTRRSLLLRADDAASGAQRRQRVRTLLRVAGMACVWGASARPSRAALSWACWGRSDAGQLSRHHLHTRRAAAAAAVPCSARQRHVAAQRRAPARAAACRLSVVAGCSAVAAVSYRMPHRICSSCGSERGSEALRRGAACMHARRHAGRPLAGAALAQWWRVCVRFRARLILSEESVEGTWVSSSPRAPAHGCLRWLLAAAGAARGLRRLTCFWAHWRCRGDGHGALREEGFTRGVGEACWGGVRAAASPARSRSGEGRRAAG